MSRSKIPLRSLPAMGGRETIRDLFSGAGRKVCIRKEWTAANTKYNLIQRLAEDYYLSMYIDGTYSIGGEFMRLGKMYLNRLYRAHGKDSTSITFGGGSWVHTYGDTYLGGYISYRHVADSYVEVVTADGVTEVGALTINAMTNAGAILVSIDGDKTRADLLPTAQALVDAGTLANTVLVANGGTLNPTDRIWNMYNIATANVLQLFSSSLAAGVHTVRMTVTGYKQTASTGTYCLFNTILEWGPGVHDTTATLFHLRPVSNVFTTDSNPVWEVSWSLTPTGATNAEWVGHAGSLKFTVLPTITVDGVTRSPARGEAFSGSEVKIVMQFAVRHSETGATDLGLMDTEYRLDSVTGLTISHSTTWGVGGLVTGYPCMFALDSLVFDRGKNNVTAITTLGLADGASKLQSQDNEFWTWDYDGGLAAYFGVPNVGMTVNNWIDSGANKFFVIDHANHWNKAYFNRFTNTVYNIGDTWKSAANYRFAWFPGGANAALG